MDRLDALEALIASFETSSFAAAGRQLGKSRDHVSKAVAELESQLGFLLVHRTTRRVVPTEAGQACVAAIRPLLAGIRQADLDTLSHARGVRRRMVVDAPSMWGMAVLAPKVTAFLQACPDVEIRLMLADEFSALHATAADLTIRLASAIDPELCSERLGECRRFLCAAPAYLARHEAPRHPDALARHECLLYENLSTGKVWVLRRRGEVRRIAVTGRFSSNNGALLAAAAVAGHGIVMLPDFVARPHLATGRLVKVLPGWEAMPLVVHAIFHPDRAESPAVRGFVDFVRGTPSTRAASTARRRRGDASGEGP